MKRILPASFYNPLTLVGSVIALFNLALIALLLVVDLLAKRPRPYSDLIILLILPVFIPIGVAFIILGIIRQRRRQKAAQAIVTVQDLYDRNYDPAMKESWKSYPSQSGHMYSPGCFRRHDGKHRSDDGTVLSRDCSLCHLLIEQAAGRSAERADRAVFRVMKYPHPVDIGDSWKEVFCHECHGVGR